MPRQDRVTPLGTSKELVKWMGGVETEKVWYKTIDNKNTATATKDEWALWSSSGLENVKRQLKRMGENVTHECVPAYTTDDLMERLPIHLDNWKYVFRFCINCDMGGENRRYHLSYRRVKDEANTSDWLVCFEHINLTECLAQLVIFCGESGYLEEEKG